MGKPKILQLGLIGHARESWNALSKVADITVPNARHREDFMQECKSGRFDEVVAIYRTFQSVEITGLFDDELITALPPTVKFICHNGAGYDQINIEACTAKEILVSNVQSAIDNATADTNMFLILGALRGFNLSMASLREGRFRGSPPPPLGRDPEGKTLGILGMGGIGRNLMKKAEAFSMKVIYHNRKPLGKQMAGCARYVDFEELLRTSDVLSLNLPLNKSTRHIISTSEFQLMKPGVIVVNTARGAIIDEEALVVALNSGKVASAGLDVFEEEPAIHPGLLSNKSVMLLPHMGTYTSETETAMEEWTIANVRQAVETGTLRNTVPEQDALCVAGA